MKRIGIYGISGVGKTTVVAALKSKFQEIRVGGESEGIKAYFNNKFDDFLALDEVGRQNAREQALAAYFSPLTNLEVSVVIDAHYSFWVNGSLKEVIPDSSKEIYSHFIYLNPGVKEILKRHKTKWGEERFTASQIEEWLEFETSGLIELCLSSSRSFIEVNAISLDDAVSELGQVINK